MLVRREADAARKQISALETQILEQMETLETAEASLNERADEIATLLEQHGLPPSALELEITETSIEADPAGTDSLVERLHAMGERLERCDERFLGGIGERREGVAPE